MEMIRLTWLISVLLPITGRVSEVIKAYVKDNMKNL